ncbi:hypothetical protein [Sphingobium yanoikuyae]|uniref:hypothetical protein n=1 Tax=Sphingobium yanoikuyae TaxID=13690 RepID=UPI0035B043F5
MSSSFHTIAPGWLDDAMRKAMQDEAQRIVAEESDAAQRRVAERLSGMVDNLALSPCRITAPSIGETSLSSVWTSAH